MPSIPPKFPPPSEWPTGRPEENQGKISELAQQIDSLLQQIGQCIEKKDSPAILEKLLQTLETKMEELKKLAPHSSTLKAFEEFLLELNAELLKIQANFGTDEKGMIEICAMMQSELSRILDELNS